LDKGVATGAYPVKRNAFLLAAGLVCLSGMFQLTVALATTTLVVVTGIEGILGLGPAIFLLAGSVGVLPAGRLMDRVGRMPVIQGGFLLGAVGTTLTALGCWWESATLVILGFGCAGIAAAVVLLSRAAAAEMFPPAKRARGISFVLFGAVSGAIWGPLVFGPMFSGRHLTAHGLVVPWLSAGLFMIAGFLVSLGVRPDPKTIAATHPDDLVDTGEAAPLRQILRRPGIPQALVAAVASFGVMAGVMNLSGYVALGHGHAQSDVFTIISAHIVGMYGLVLVVGDVIDRIGRRTALVGGLAIISASCAALIWLDGLLGMSVALFGLGLGWNLSYVAATTELVSRAAPSERGRLVGFSDLLSAAFGATLALAGGAIYSADGVMPLAALAAALAALPAIWLTGRATPETAPEPA
jgi:MFS family permease